MCGVVEMNKEAEWAKTAPYCELHRPTRRYTHSNRNIVLPLLKSFRKARKNRLGQCKVTQFALKTCIMEFCIKFNTFPLNQVFRGVDRGVSICQLYQKK